jgi:hypothetical protein
MTKYIFILIPLLCYSIQGFLCIKGKDYSHSLVWFSYAMGNVGFIWYEITK